MDNDSPARPDEPLALRLIDQLGLLERLREAAQGEELFGFDGLRDEPDALLTEAANEIERLRDALKTAQYRGMVDERIAYKGYSYGMRSMSGIADLRRAIERDKNY